MKEIFQQNENYDNRSGVPLAIRNMHTVHVGTDTDYN